MRDFTLSCYHDSLWIKQIMHLKGSKGKYMLRTRKGIIPISLVTIFGTIVEARHLGEQCQLITVDDGTGQITCRYNTDSKDLDELEDWDWKDLASSDASRSELTIAEASSMCDSVFNDRTMQQEEQETQKRARLKALESLRWSIVNSFRSSQLLAVGDAVSIHGKLYSYFDVNQLYINVIRPITMAEELSLMTIKLQDSRCSRGQASQSASLAGKSTLGESTHSQVNQGKSHASTQGQTQHVSAHEPMHKMMRAKRPSGLMTFDTVQEGRVHVAMGLPEGGALPPTPVTRPGALVVPACNPEPQTTFDTLHRVDEPSNSSSDDSDMFIPPTPTKDR